MTTLPTIPKLALVLLVGPSGAGKSTLASKKFPAGEIYSSDKIREEINGDFRNQQNHGLVFRTLHQRTKNALDEGKRVVVDATNLKQKDRLSFIADLPYPIPVIYVVFNRSMNEKIRTGGWRLEVENLLERHDRIFRQNEQQILKGDGMALVIDARDTDFIVE